MYDYIEANDLRSSPLLDSSQSGLRWIEEMLALYDGFLLSSQGTLKPGVRMEETVTNILSFDDFTLDELPALSRQGLRDTKNRIVIEYLDRATSYNIATAKVDDDSSINATGERIEHRTMPSVTRPTVAAALVARAMLTLGYPKMALTMGWDPRLGLHEPGDLFTIPDARLGILGVAFRVVGMREKPTWGLTVEAIDEPLATVPAVSFAVTPPEPPPGPVPPGTEVAPTTGFVFELPYEIAGENTVFGVIAVGSGSAWAGADVAMSVDGVDFTPVATIARGAVAGRFTAPLFADGPTQIGVTTEVDASISEGSLASVSHEAFWALANQFVCNLSPSVTGGVVQTTAVEFIAWEQATLLATARYRLTNFLRRLYDSPGSDHVNGEYWARIDTAFMAVVPYARTLIGTQITFRFISRSASGTSEAAPTYVSITPVGVALEPDPIDGLQIQRVDAVLMRGGTII